MSSAEMPSPGVLDDVTAGAVGADLPDECQHQILGRHAGTESAAHGHPHVAHHVVDQGLRGQQMLDLAAADAETQGAHGAVRRGVAVAGGDHHAGQHQALFTRYHVLDTLARIQHVEQVDAVALAIRGQRADLPRPIGVGQHHRARVAIGGGGIDMVDHGHRRCRTPDRSAGGMQCGKGLRAGVLVEHLSVDIQQDLPVLG